MRELNCFECILFECGDFIIAYRPPKQREVLRVRAGSGYDLHVESSDKWECLAHSPSSSPRFTFLWPLFGLSPIDTNPRSVSLWWLSLNMFLELDPRFGSQPQLFSYFLSSPEDMFSLIWEREIKSMGERNIINWLPSICVLTGDPDSNPDMCPDWEWNHYVESVLDNAPTN